jgi:hypothetical protein
MLYPVISSVENRSSSALCPVFHNCTVECIIKYCIDGCLYFPSHNYLWLPLFSWVLLVSTTQGYLSSLSLFLFSDKMKQVIICNFAWSLFVWWLVWIHVLSYLQKYRVSFTLTLQAVGENLTWSCLVRCDMAFLPPVKLLLLCWHTLCMVLGLTIPWLWLPCFLPSCYDREFTAPQPLWWWFSASSITSWGEFLVHPHVLFLADVATGHEFCLLM